MPDGNPNAICRQDNQANFVVLFGTKGTDKMGGSFAVEYVGLASIEGQPATSLFGRQLDVALQPAKVVLGDGDHHADFAGGH